MLASTRTNSVISSSDAAPGISDSESDNPIVIRNTGNVDFDVFLTGSDLIGRSSPAVTLSADRFKAGASLGTSVALEDGVQKDLSITVASANGAEEDVWFWLSMPSSQLLQDYYAPTAWAVVSS